MHIGIKTYSIDCKLLAVIHMVVEIDSSFLDRKQV